MAENIGGIRHSVLEKSCGTNFDGLVVKLTLAAPHCECMLFKLWISCTGCIVMWLSGDKVEKSSIRIQICQTFIDFMVNHKFFSANEQNYYHQTFCYFAVLQSFITHRCTVWICLPCHSHESISNISKMDFLTKCCCQAHLEKLQRQTGWNIDSILMLLFLLLKKEDRLLCSE